jgi:hypothetical protein
MIEKIEKCYVCDQWFDVNDLRQIKVSSQGGDVEKPICEGCIEAIEKRSWGEVRKEPRKIPG